MSNKFTNNVRTRLYKQGYQGFTKDDYTQAALAVECDDLDNPTKEQLSQAVDYLKLKVQSQISVADELVEEKLHSQVESEPSETARETGVVVELENQVEQEKPALVSEITQREGIELNEEIQLKPSIEQSEMPAITSEDDPENTAIALQEKSELVASTANDMGITLSIEEVTAIAENFDYASVNSDYEIAEIESAITAFVQHKAQVTKQKITNMVQGVRETVTRLDNENSQLLNDGLREINNDIKRGTERFKSQVRTSLKAFALPPSKTG